MKIKDSWKDVTFKEFSNFLEIEDSGNSFADSIKRVAALYSLTEPEVKKLDITTFNSISASLSFMSNMEEQPQVSFEIEGKNYNVLQNFGTESSIGQLGDSEYILNNFKGISKVPYLIGIYCQTKKEYDSNVMFELAEKFKNIPMDIILGLNSFFLLKNNLSSNGSLPFILKIKKQLMKELQLLETQNIKPHSVFTKSYLKYSLIKRYLKLMKQVASA